jgi:hypothetical protein
MSVLLLPLILLATLVVILSGIWVAVALVEAVWHRDRRVKDRLPTSRAQDANGAARNAG